MNFVNNWLVDIVLDQGATQCELDLPDGDYRLTLSDHIAVQTRWEVVGAVVVAGTATLTRAQEGTTDQPWAEGSVIYGSLTAGLLAELFTRIGSLESSAASTGLQIADLLARVTALEPSPVDLLLEILFTEASWWFGDYPIVKSVELLSAGSVVQTLDLSLFTRYDAAVGAGVIYDSGQGAVTIGYENRLTLINTHAPIQPEWDEARIGLDGIGSFNGDASTLTAYDPRAELGTNAFLGASGIVYVTVSI